MNLGKIEKVEGGAIASYDSNIELRESLFESCQAQEGGAIFSNCKETCSLTFDDTTFSMNIAKTRGGAVAYDDYRPQLTRVTFNGNEAEYGKNIGSYPVKLVLQGETSLRITNVVSGQKLSNPLEFKQLDYDDQITNLDSSSLIRLRNYDAGDVLGQRSVKLKKGVGIFTEPVFKGEPKSENV